MPFERVLKQRHVLALAFGAMIGWSWVLLSGLWIGRAGTLGAALAFVLAGVAMIFIALTYAELASAMPETGGEHVYTERAFGRGLSFVCTWALLLGYVSVVAFEVVALPVALGYLWPASKLGFLWRIAGFDVYASQVALGLAGAVLLTVINVRGIAQAASLQGWVTLLIVVSGVLLVSGALGHGASANFVPLFADGWRGVFGVLVMVPLMFVGFDVIPQAAEEIDLPPARIGAIMIVAVVCGIVWYAGIILAVGYALPAPARAASELATAEAASAAWSGSWAGTCLLAGGIAGIVTTWNAFLVGASRLTWVLAAAGMLPAWLAPRAAGPAALAPALWAICALSCLAPWFGRPALVWLVDAGSLGVIIAYALVALAFLRLRRREPAMPRPYRVPAGAACGWLAFGLSLALAALYLPPSPSALVWPQEWLLCGVWALAGVLLYRRAVRAA
jgi:basic amino acid/polyamine antiporter, APA family